MFFFGNECGFPCNAPYEARNHVYNATVQPFVGSKSEDDFTIQIYVRLLRLYSLSAEEAHSTIQWHGYEIHSEGVRPELSHFSVFTVGQLAGIFRNALKRFIDGAEVRILSRHTCGSWQLTLFLQKGLINPIKAEADSRTQIRRGENMESRVRILAIQYMGNATWAPILSIH